MPATYDSLATTTLGTTAASITFSGIVNTFTDLRLVIVPISSAASQNLFMQVNGDTTTNYARVNLTAYNNTITTNRSGSSSNINLIANDGFDIVPTFYTVDFISYASATYKNMLITSNEEKNAGTVTNNALKRTAAIWRNTSAITTIYLYCDTTFAAGTTATLYGIKAA